MSAPHGRPKGRIDDTGEAKLRTAIPPSLAEGVEGRVLQ